VYGFGNAPSVLFAHRSENDDDLSVMSCSTPPWLLTLEIDEGGHGGDGDERKQGDRLLHRRLLSSVACARVARRRRLSLPPRSK
jgi:hypothetical protein